MGKINVGNKQNSFLNREWVGHARKWLKQNTSGLRSSWDKKVINREINEWRR